MSTRWKIILAILLAFFASYLWGATPRPDMQKFYAGYNEEYFDDTLPKDVTVTWANLSQQHNLGITYEYENGRIEIKIDRAGNPSERQAQLTLLHEMCHVKVGVGLDDGPSSDRGHGPEHEACMVRVALRGGFKGLW